MVPFIMIETRESRTGGPRKKKGERGKGKSFPLFETQNLRKEERHKTALAVHRKTLEKVWGTDEMEGGKGEKKNLSKNVILLGRGSEGTIQTKIQANTNQW